MGGARTWWEEEPRAHHGHGRIGACCAAGGRRAPKALFLARGTAARQPRRIFLPRLAVRRRLTSISTPHHAAPWHPSSRQAPPPARRRASARPQTSTLLRRAPPRRPPRRPARCAATSSAPSSCPRAASRCACATSSTTSSRCCRTRRRVRGARVLRRCEVCGAELTRSADSKLDSKSDLHVLNELAELNNCNVRRCVRPMCCQRADVARAEHALL